MASLKAVYGICGSDATAREAVRKRLSKRVADEGGTEFVMVDRKMPAIVADLTTPSLLGGTRLIVIPHADELKKEAAKQLAEALPLVPPGTTVCLLAETTLPAALNRIAEQSGGVVRRDKQGTPRAQVQTAAKRQGVVLAPDALARLAEIAGLVSPLAIDHELAKLSLLGIDPVTAEIVDAVASFENLPSEPWALLDAVSMRDGKAAVRELQKLWHSGENPVRLAGLVKGRLRRLSTVVALAKHGAKASHVAKRLEVSPTQAAKLLKASAKWNLPDLARASYRMEWDEREMMSLGDTQAGRVTLERALPGICARQRG